MVWRKTSEVVENTGESSFGEAQCAYAESEAAAGFGSRVRSPKSAGYVTAASGEQLDEVIENTGQAEFWRSTGQRRQVEGNSKRWAEWLAANRRSPSH